MTYIVAKQYRIEMQNGETWLIPVSLIVQNRAEFYREEFGGDIEHSLEADTIPLFESDEYAIEDWAKNNMNWSDVERFAVRVKGPDVDYQDEWMKGEVEIIDSP